MKFFRKAYGYFIRYTFRGTPQLLVFTAPDRSLRLPGGTVEECESVFAGLRRELQEEVGLNDFRFLRQLGVQRYTKSDVQKDVERHDYLLQAITPLPDQFSVTVQGCDKDAGLTFDYHWIDAGQIDRLDWEFKNYLTPEYLPEFF
jgi:ADP-ribose pyrophosphatase YjhB (NUDIX family)